ncbi:methionine--tRNA ligase [Pseudostreptobacillus hongkongensis]|uniref:methionine--tRNA ligase n=1 Tax=Pseudostreptobacillus hongkongensis TaxID=1162717 RepID=UPI0008366D30|nr:methionine--tRNA ligase [Pseudostreptobacillus hongkongensis]
MMKNLYITTPIYYPNAKPHIGTAYTTVICDVVSRYKRLKGYDVRFITGIDEHGQKIEESAKKNNVTPQQWVDKMKEDFVNLWDKLNIDYNYFVRTTDSNHEYTVDTVIQKVYDNGKIYSGEYIGKYSVSEETFVTESQLVDGKYMGKEVIDMAEKSYFFKLSEYQDKLLEFYENHPDFIKPVSRRNEVISFIKQGLQDLSISRTTFDWGIPLKLEKGHIVYVWFDALNSYLTAAGYGSELFNEFWNNGEVVHVIGKDILRFHAIIWPAMLMAAGYKLPDVLAVHGWWTIDGEKMSKSLGNVVDPLEEIEKYGLDQFRYFLLREATFGQDADYSKKAVIQRINSDLANDLGNLLNRVLGMQAKYFDSVVYKSDVKSELDNELIELWKETLFTVDNMYNDYNFSEMLKSIWKFISRLNKYIDESEPWALYKEGNIERLKAVLYNLIEGISKVALLVYPVMPDSSQNILYQLGLDIKVSSIKLGDYTEWGIYSDGNKLGESKVLFPRIEVPKIEFEEELVIQNPIDIEDFNKVEIKVVEIKKVYKVPESDALLRFIVDTGKELRQIVSGIAKHYKNEQELVGTKVMAVLNLKSIELKGIVSQGMLLTTTEKKKTKLVVIDENVKVSTIIK